jgi:hypothetical protein
MQTSAPPPAGDSCADSPPVLPVVTLFMSTLADGSANDTQGTCGGATGADKVHSFSVASSQHVTVTANSTGWPFVMYLRQGTDCSTATEIRCVASAGGSATIDVPSLAGPQTYWVWVDATTSTVGPYSILLQESNPVTPPANDNCSGAITLVQGNQNGTLIGANQDYSGSCNPTGGPDVVYTFTLAATSSVLLSATPGISTDRLALYVQSGTCGTGTEMKCANATSGTETLQIGSLPPGQYWVFVQGVGPVSDTFTLNYLIGPPAPPNDSCSAPQTLTFSGSPPSASTAGTLVNATDDASGTCGGSGQPDVVYMIPQAAFGGANKRVRAVVSGATFDPVLYLQSTCGGSQVGCAQTRQDSTEVLDLPNLAPANYFLWVDKFPGSGATSSFSLSVQLLTAITPPSNDSCSAPAALTPVALTNATPTTIPGILATSGSTLGANNDYTESCNAIDGRDVVYSLTLGSTSQLVLELEPITQFYLPVYSLRTAANCSTTAGDTACLLNERFLNCPSVNAGTYDLIVDGEGGSVGDFTVRAMSGAAASGFGYAVIDVPLNFTERAGQPGSTLLVDYRDYTALPLGSAMRTATVTFPFDVNMFGQVYTAGTSATVYEAGFLSFDSPPLTGTNAALYRNVCAPAAAQPNAYIAPLWDDLMSWGNPFGGRIWMAVSGSAPSRKVTIEWEAYDFWQEGHHEQALGNGYYVECAGVSAQAILYESGDFEFQYHPIAINENYAGTGMSTLNTTLPNRTVGSHATIGIENANGSVAIQRACNADTTETNSGSAQFGTCPVTSTLGAACTGTKGYRIIPPRCVP